MDWQCALNITAYMTLHYCFQNQGKNFILIVYEQNIFARQNKEKD